MSKYMTHKDEARDEGRPGVTTKAMVMFDSDEAAQRKTVTGWMSRDGLFFGEDERTARYSGCTHRKCETCDNAIEKGYIYCRACTTKRYREKFEALESKEWDGVTPLCTYDDDRYFFDWESIEEYCDENGCTPDDLMLVICKPIKPHLFDAGDLFADYLPEDGECPDAVAEALEGLNKAIIEADPFSWYPDKFKAAGLPEYKPEVEGGRS